jgi:hypothetical protein
MAHPRVLQNRWSAAVASVIGLTVGTESITTFTFDAFLGPATLGIA